MLRPIVRRPVPAYAAVALIALAGIGVPIALVGGLIGNYMAGGVISIGSLVGFFTVLGIVARNGIMMISHFQHLEDKEGRWGKNKRERTAARVGDALQTV